MQGPGNGRVASGGGLQGRGRCDTRLRLRRLLGIVSHDYCRAACKVVHDKQRSFRGRSGVRIPLSTVLHREDLVDSFLMFCLNRSTATVAHRTVHFVVLAAAAGVRPFPSSTTQQSLSDGWRRWLATYFLRKFVGACLLHRAGQGTPIIGRR